MTCLITGATGFIGRRLIRRLVADIGPSSIVCLIRPPRTALAAETLDSYRSMGVRLLEGDLLRKPVTVEVPPHVDIVFHLAANTDTESAEEEARVNHTGTANLLTWLRPVSRGVRIVYASSIAVHDRDRRAFGPVFEESPHVPRTAYGRTKLKGEQIIREQAIRDGCSWTIVRLPAVYGPGQAPGSALDKIIHMAASGSLLGRVDWPGRLSTIHVDDVVDVMVDLGARTEAANEVFCVGSDRSVTIGEFARAVGDAVGQPVTPIALPPSLRRVVHALVWNRALQAAVPRLAQVFLWRVSLIVGDGFWFDTTKLRRVYHKPIRNIEEGLRDTLAAARHGQMIGPRER